MKAILLCFAILLASNGLRAAAQDYSQNDSTEEQVRQLLQDTPTVSDNNLGPATIIPARRGFNLSLITTSQHDSAVGWLNILTPALAYRINTHASATASTPLFLYLRATTFNGTVDNPRAADDVHHVPGDTSLAGHYALQLAPKLTYISTGTLSLPTGDRNLGVGAGQVTYDVNNHFGADLRFNPFVELGIGDNSALVNGRVRRSQNSVGLLSHFEVGGGVLLPHGIDLSASVYEILPIAAQTVTSPRPVRQLMATSLTGQNGLAEDNGLNTSVDIPLQSHITLSGFYNRSLRQHDDTVGFSFTFLARGNQQPR